MLTINEIKYMIKVIKSPQYREILLKGTAIKRCQKVARVALPLIKNMLPSLAKNILLPIGLTAAA